jgi:hypothetical protein
LFDGIASLGVVQTRGFHRTGPSQQVGIKFAASRTMASTARPTVYVTIVAARAETLDGLRTYLSLAGLEARGTRRLGDSGRRPCAAIVFFPDEFLPDDVLKELSRLRRQRPTVLPLLVTREPQRYVEITGIEGVGLAPVVIPKPAWGWTILDAIRLAVAHQDGPRRISSAT